MEYKVSRASPADHSKIDEFVDTVFLPDMPLMHAFSIDTSPGTVGNLPAPHHPSTDSLDIYLKAVDPKGQIIGIAVVKEKVDFGPESEASPEWMEMAEFMDFIEEDAKLHELPERTTELLVLSVHSAWRQRGVARRLVEESVSLARGYGFQTMKVCCTSEFTARLVRGLGWREHYRLAYKDYPTRSGRAVQLKPTPPHDFVYYYVTDL